MKIFKYDIDLTNLPVTEIEFPEGGKLRPIHVAFQSDGFAREYPRVWCEVTDRESWEDDGPLRLEIVATGGSVQGDALHIGTMISEDGQIVLHVYDLDGA